MALFSRRRAAACFDNRFVGRSALLNPPAYRDCDLAEAVWDLADHLGGSFAGPVVLVALADAAALVALRAAAVAPQRVAALVLVGAVFDAAALGGVSDELAKDLAEQRRVLAQGAACDTVPSTVPVLVVHGAADRVVPIERAREWVAQRGAGARLAAVPGAGHLCLVSHPGPCWRAIQAFLDALPGSPKL